MQEHFGQEVTLIVHDLSGDRIVLDASGLRVDFDVRLIDGFSRATFTIYNLAEASIRDISNGENYVTVNTKLHGKNEFTVANSFYISNVLEERKLPNSVTTLYCLDSMKRQFLESQIDISVKLPTLRREMRQACEKAGMDSEIRYHSFPFGKVDQESPRKVPTPAQGSLQSVIRKLQGTYKFKLYTAADGGLDCMYLPTLDELKSTYLNTRNATVKLDVVNMKSNPKIGPGSLLITSNLDGNIRPTSILDISDLFKIPVIGTSVDEESLQLIKTFLKDTISGFTKYQTVAVRHTGSNFTAEWKTVATATSPSEGKRMSPLSWQRGT